MRASRGVKIFFEGELCAEMPSVGSTADLLMLHDPKNRGHSSVKSMLNKVCKDGGELFGFTFEKDANWKPSRPVRETNVLTGETFVSTSVNEMSTRVFGADNDNGTPKMVALCRTGREHKGFKYEYVNEDYYKCSSNMVGKRPVKAVLQIKDGVTLKRFSSVREAGNHILVSGESNSKNLIAIKNRISACANFDRHYKKYLGYTWRYV